MTYSDENKVDGIVLVSEDAQEYLNPRQEVTYREHRRELAEWMLALGKNPDKAEGYSYSTAKNRMNRIRSSLVAVKGELTRFNVSP